MPDSQPGALLSTQATSNMAVPAYARCAERRHNYPNMKQATIEEIAWEA